MAAATGRLIGIEYEPRKAVRRPSTPTAGGVLLTPDSMHDLTSPVNQICSLVDLIVKKHESGMDDDFKTVCSHLQSSAQRLLNLMSGLKSYLRLVASAGPFRSADGNLLLTVALSTLKEQIARNEAVITHDRLPELCCDPLQMTYVFTGLIENAIKFRSENKPEIHVGVSANRRGWVLSIRDNGIGVDPRQAERIFATFKRIHNDAYPGAGVGLAIAKHVIERHGGRIWVESEFAQGATFFVELPKTERCRSKSRAGGRKYAVA